MQKNSLFCKYMELITGFEPVTSSLPRKCSTDWAIWAKACSLYGAGGGNRTRIISLEGWGLTITQRPHHNHTFGIHTLWCRCLFATNSSSYLALWWGEVDSNHRSFRVRFTVWSLWPLGNPPKTYRYLPSNHSQCRPSTESLRKMELARGVEPPTGWLQVSCSTNWATPASQ